MAEIDDPCENVQHEKKVVITLTSYVNCEFTPNVSDDEEINKELMRLANENVANIDEIRCGYYSVESIVFD